VAVLGQEGRNAGSAKEPKIRPVSLPFLWMEAFHFDSHLLRGKNGNAVGTGLFR
jgi:hypothetical protein